MPNARRFFSKGREEGAELNKEKGRKKLRRSTWSAQM